MRWAAYILVILVALLLQVTLMVSLEVGGVRPELGLLVALFFAMNLKFQDAAIVGWSAGMLQDLLSGGALGTYALVYMCIALTVSHFREELYTKHIVTQIGIAFPAALLASGAALLRLTVLSTSLDFGVSLERAFIVSVYTAFTAPFMFALLGLLKGPLGLLGRRDFLHV